MISRSGAPAAMSGVDKTERGVNVLLRQQHCRSNISPETFSVRPQSLETQFRSLRRAAQRDLLHFVSSDPVKPDMFYCRPPGAAIRVTASSQRGRACDVTEIQFGRRRGTVQGRRVVTKHGRGLQYFCHFWHRRRQMQKSLC